LLAGKTGLEQAKKLIIEYKQGTIREMTPELWKAKKIVDSTLHPGMGPVGNMGSQLVLISGL
jgi:sideroflexin-5